MITLAQISKHKYQEAKLQQINKLKNLLHMKFAQKFKPL
jgi:hypothetical protein